jgi:hypothetical protein
MDSQFNRFQNSLFSLTCVLKYNSCSGKTDFCLTVAWDRTTFYLPTGRCQMALTGSVMWPYFRRTDVCVH